MKVGNGAKSVFWHLATPIDCIIQRTEIQNLVIQSQSVEGAGNSKIKKKFIFFILFRPLAPTAADFSLPVIMLQSLLIRCFATIMMISILFTIPFHNIADWQNGAGQVPSDIEPSIETIKPL